MVGRSVSPWESADLARQVVRDGGVEAIWPQTVPRMRRHHTLHAVIDWSLFGSIRSLGITAGASAPEVLVEEIIDAFAERYEVSVESVSTADESVFFPLPRELREQAAE